MNLIIKLHNISVVSFSNIDLLQFMNQFVSTNESLMKLIDMGIVHPDATTEKRNTRKSVKII